MHGVYLFSEGNDYSADLPIFTLGDGVTVTTKAGTFTSFQNRSKDYWGLDVLFEPPVSIIKGNSYLIIAAISGPVSFGGRNGNIHVESSGVTFMFENSAEQGQFPEFIFSLPD